MKIKEIRRSANISWSPLALTECYLATATLAQQLDSTFDTASVLEIFLFNPANKSMDMPCVGKFALTQPLHKLLWTHYNTQTNGIIIGSGDAGNIWLYDAGSILSTSAETFQPASTASSHTGPVRTLDISVMQSNLLASGSVDSEIYIWDLNKPLNVMSPGGKIQPFEEVSCVSWNRKMAPILGSTFPSGQTVVWDLRKNVPILRVNSPGTRFRPKSMCWHPDVATQMVISSEEDTYPVVQLWDLRMAKSPIRTLEKHQRGVLSVAWCQQDSDLLLTCGRDNQVFLWNPNSQATDQLFPTNGWCCDIQWSSRYPGLLAMSAFDNRVSIYSILGGGATEDELKLQHAKISQHSDPFDPFANLSQHDFISPACAPPPKPPKWIQVVCRANFGFGGKLVTISKGQKQPHISSFSTETEFIDKSLHLESIWRDNKFLEYTQDKIINSGNSMDKTVWLFIEAAFHNNPRPKFLELLGYTENHLKQLTSQKTILSPGVDPHELSEKMQALLRSKSHSPTSITSPIQDISGPTGQQLLSLGQLAETGQQTGMLDIAYDRSADLLSGNTASSLFVKEGPMTGDDFLLNNETSAVLNSESTTLDTNKELARLLVGDSDDNIDSIYSQNTLLPMEDINQQLSQFTIQSDESSIEGLISQSILLADYDTAVDLCLQQKRYCEALILSLAGGKELYQLTLEKYFRQFKNPFSRLINCIINKQWTEIVECVSYVSWREVLACLLTYAPPEDFFKLCGELGHKLYREGGSPEYTQAALLCYICSGNMERLAYMLDRTECGAGSGKLINIIEKIILLRISIEMQSRPEEIQEDSILEKLLLEYIELLVSEGYLSSALAFIDRLQIRSRRAQILSYRIRELFGEKQNEALPFKVINIQPASTPGSQMGQESSSGYSSLQTDTPGQQYPPPNTSLYRTTAASNPTTPHVPQQYYQPTPNQPAGTSQTSVPPNTMHPAWNDPPAVRPDKRNSGYIPPITLPTPPVTTAHPTDSMGQIQQAGYNSLQNANTLSNTTPAQPVPELPNEYKPMIQIFEDLLSRCKQASTNPAHKHKLADIQNKLTQLTESLTYNKLESAVIQGLSQIAVNIQHRHYDACQPIISSCLVSGNFSELAFMTGIKSMLQIAKQLHI